MDRSKELRERWSLSLYDHSGSVGAPDAYYLALRLDSYMEDPYLDLDEFEDAQDAAAFIRYCAIPSLRSPSDRTIDDVNAYARDFYDRDEDGLARFMKLLRESQRAAEGPVPVAVMAMGDIVHTFNDVYESVFGGAEIEGYGALSEVLSRGLLAKGLEWGADEEGDEYPYAELARLVAEGRFDDADPRHRQLAAEYAPDGPTGFSAGSWQ